MTTKIFKCISLLCVMVLLAGSDNQSWIHFPKEQKDHSPPPVIVDTTKIKADQLYVVSCDLEAEADVFPPGIASLTVDKGPLRIRGKFVDGSDKLETRLYNGKTIIMLEPIQSGAVTLLVVPNGKGKADWIKKNLTIDNGVIPPLPDNNEDTKPKPKPDPTPVVDQKLFIVYVEADGRFVNNRGVFISNPDIVSRIKDKGHKVRIVDKDVVGPDGQTPKDVKRFIDACTGKDYPQLFIVDQKGYTLKQTDWNDSKQPIDLINILKAFGG